MNFETDILTVFDKKWALLTAGNKESFNTMTVSWGGMGTIWGDLYFRRGSSPA